MSLLSAKNLGVSFGAFDLFKGISVNIANDAKIGLIGPNGIGKTTLTLILAGIYTPTTGEVSIAKSKRMGYLRQEAVEAFANRDNTVYDEMLSVFTTLRETQTYLHELEAQMANANGDLDALLERYGKVQAEFELAGGYDYELRTQQTLEGLGLGKETWDMPLNHLSGGQKTRALLAKLLLEKPDLLMLDEPSNHLDIDAVEWLERTIREWQGAVLIVSHDRYFLDNTVNTIWEMSANGIETYSGTYSSYLLQRQERWEYLERVFKEEKARLTKQVDFIQKNWVRDSTHAQALGRLRRLSRELAAIDQYGIMVTRSGKKWSELGIRSERPLDVIEAIRKVNALQMPGHRPPEIRPQFNKTHNSGNIVLRINQVEIGYPGNSLFTASEVELTRDECAVLIGPNGSGKTTFLKVLLGQLPPLSGELLPGASLQIGYFAQAQEKLKGDHDVLTEFLAHKEMNQESARKHLAAYLFRGEDVFKPLNGLSGGERARLALAILAIDGVNFLVLDEPTNHLDIPAREALQELLEAFPGTILLVSHDRYLIDRLATQVWEIKDSKLEIFNGRYRDYVLRKPSGNNINASRGILLKTTELPRDNSRATKKRMLALEQVEERIRDNELKIKKLSKQLEKAGASGAFEEMNTVSRDIAKTQAHLEELLHEWEKLAE
jgi:ATP-binding cassette subfamily F protein 3